MNCKHCGQPIRVCQVGNCTGWARTKDGCPGWMHYDLFHGCDDGKHQAEPEGDGECGTPAEPGVPSAASAGDPLTRGHIIPRAHGGPDEPWNIRPEHLSCNQERATRWTREDSAEAIRRRFAS